jgi:hypothetical protein
MQHAGLEVDIPSPECQQFAPPLCRLTSHRLFGGQDVPSRATILQPFTLADAAEVRTLVAGTGFHDIDIRIRTHPIRFASVEAYTLGFLSSIPIASEVAAMEETARARMIQDLRNDAVLAPRISHV